MLRFTASWSDRLSPGELSASSANSEFIGERDFASARPVNRDRLHAPCAANTLHPLVGKLMRFVALGDEETVSLVWATRNSRTLRAKQVLFHEDSRPDHVCLITRGMAYRYKMLANGRRQILGYLMPGDLCDVHFVVSNKLDHSVALLTDSEVVRIPLNAIVELASRYRTIDRALTLVTLLDQAILREWLLGVGQRDGLQRMGHFFCEMYQRAGAVGAIARDGSIDLPINQYALADTTGLTPVHVNRILQRLRREKLIELRQRRLHILDYNRLAEKSGFDGQYLRPLLMA